MFKNKPIQRKVFIYLISFSILILILLWFFQVFFLKYYYESFKTNELESTLSTIKITYNHDNENIYDLLENFSYDNGICSEVIINGKVSYTTNPLNRGCLSLYDKQSEILTEKLNFLNSDKEKFRLRIVNKSYTNKTLVYGIKLNDNTSIFVNTSIDPIDSTVTILKKQLIIITIIIIILSSIVAYFIASKLSRPLMSLTKKSRELSKGNFNVDFDVNTDVNEIKELATSLNYTKDVLKNNDELRRDLMANVSHDLKTPLTMIKAYAEMVRDLSYNDSNKRTNNLNVIIDEVDRLTILVNDILSLSKLESNLENINIEEFDLAVLVNTIIERFKIFSITQDYTFICHYPEKIIINADRQRIEQVIYNLMSNAINYSQNSKKLYITINITDTGPGINKDDINKIWDKYYKSDKSYKRNAIGTGLGLSIVKNILEQHNYKYGVISKKGKGTTFYFEINYKKNKKEHKNN